MSDLSVYLLICLSDNLLYLLIFHFMYFIISFVCLFVCLLIDFLPLQLLCGVWPVLHFESQKTSWRCGGGDAHAGGSQSPDSVKPRVSPPVQSGWSEQQLDVYPQSLASVFWRNFPLFLETAPVVLINQRVDQSFVEGDSTHALFLSWHTLPSASAHTHKRRNHAFTLVTKQWLCAAFLHAWEIQVYIQKLKIEKVSSPNSKLSM